MNICAWNVAQTPYFLATKKAVPVGLPFPVTGALNIRQLLVADATSRLSGHLITLSRFVSRAQMVISGTAFAQEMIDGELSVLKNMDRSH